MKKTSLNNFDGKLISKNEAFAIQSEDYLSKLVANKVYVSPLQNVRGNIESSTSQENIIIILEGMGSMEVNGSRVPVNAGDVLLLKKNDVYTLSNDTLDTVLQFVSVFPKK